MILISEPMNLFGQLVGLIERGISPTQGLYLCRTTQHRKTWIYIHDPSGIRTRDSSIRAVEDSTCFRSYGHWNWQKLNMFELNDEVIGYRNALIYHIKVKETTRMS
jgi:hypothetical protein